MGHRRFGTLPKSERWRDIVASIDVAVESGNVDAVVAATLENVKQRLSHIESDSGVHASFKFLVELAVAAKQGNLGDRLAARGIDVQSDPTPLALARSLGKWVDSKQESLEYGALAKAAAADALAAWYASSQSVGPKLFEDSPPPSKAWRDVSTGAGFCELSRLYFAKFTERYLRYFLDREASAQLRSVGDRERLDADLQDAVTSVSKHAFETAKITQSFAAGWYNRYASARTPTDRQIGGFLSHAFGKLHNELRREGLK